MTIDEAQQRSAREETQPAAAFETIFREHWARIYGVLFRLVGDPYQADDLALEVFWRLYRRPPAVVDEGRLAGWLYRVATNLGLNALRSVQRRTRYEQEAGMQALQTTPVSDPAVEAELAEERWMVRRALANMKPRSARLLILRHSGLSYAELALSFGLAQASIGALLTRAEREFEEQYRKLK